MVAVQHASGGRTYRTLTREDLRNFDQEATALVLWAGEHDWVGRISSKGHAIMRAPDGQATMSVARDSLRGRSGRNAMSEFQRWLKTKEPGYVPDTALSAALQAAVKTRETGPEHHMSERKKEPEKVPEAAKEPSKAYPCDQCEKSFDRPQALGAHKSLHRPGKVCADCARIFKHEDAYQKHLAMHAAASPTSKAAALTAKPVVVLAPKPKKSAKIKFECQTCGKAYERKAWLDKHVQEHKSEAAQATAPRDAIDIVFSLAQELEEGRIAKREVVKLQERVAALEKKLAAAG